MSCPNRVEPPKSGSYLKVFSQIHDPIFVSLRLAILVSLFVLRLCFVFRSALRLAKVAIVICLVFRVGGCAMGIRLAFCNYELPFLWLAIINCLCNCD